MDAAAFWTLVIMGWTVSTTFFALYLSWINNERYNKKIVECLEALKLHVCGTDIVDLKALAEKRKFKNRLKGFHLTRLNPFKKEEKDDN